MASRHRIRHSEPRRRRGTSRLQNEYAKGACVTHNHWRGLSLALGMTEGRTRKSFCNTRAGLNQTAALEVADVFASGALDHLDGELEQANFPGLIHPLDDRAIRITGALHYAPGAIDD